MPKWQRTGLRCAGGGGASSRAAASRSQPAALVAGRCRRQARCATTSACRSKPNKQQLPRRRCSCHAGIPSSPPGFTAGRSSCSSIASFGMSSSSCANSSAQRREETRGQSGWVRRCRWGAKGEAKQLRQRGWVASQWRSRQRVYRSAANRGRRQGSGQGHPISCSACNVRSTDGSNGVQAARASFGTLLGAAGVPLGVRFLFGAVKLAVERALVQRSPTVCWQQDTFELCPGQVLLVAVVVPAPAKRKIPGVLGVKWMHQGGRCVGIALGYDYRA